MPGQRIAVVTDSTAYLPEELVGGFAVVPLSVAMPGRQGREGSDVAPGEVAAALLAHPSGVTTSRPSPADFSAVYRRLLEQGASGVVSIHISAMLSGTYEAAGLASAEFAGRVLAVDSRSTGMGLGFPALAARHAANRGLGLHQVRDAALDAIARTATFFYVDTLEFLRRGGRIGAGQALLGTALSVKPILYVADGSVVLREKVRTAGRALNRLADLTVAAAGDSDVDLAVHHLVAPERADALLAVLAERLGERLRHRYVTEVGGAVAAHVGPGLVGVVVHRRSDSGSAS